MAKRCRVTGKFDLYNKAGHLLKKDIFLNKIVTVDSSTDAKDMAIKDLEKIFTKRYEIEVILKASSTIRVRNAK